MQDRTSGFSNPAHFSGIIMTTVTPAQIHTLADAYVVHLAQIETGSQYAAAALLSNGSSRVHILDARTLAPTASFAVNAITSMASPSPTQILTSGKDGALTLWDTRSCSAAMHCVFAMPSRCIFQLSSLSPESRYSWHYLYGLVSSS